MVGLVFCLGRGNCPQYQFTSCKTMEDPFSQKFQICRKMPGYLEMSPDLLPAFAAGCCFLLFFHFIFDSFPEVALFLLNNSSCWIVNDGFSTSEGNWEIKTGECVGQKKH